MIHYSTRLTTITTKLHQPRLAPDTPQPSWLPTPAIPSTPPCSTLSTFGLGQCTPPPAPSDATSVITSHRGQQLQFSCTFCCQESPPGLRATWPPALVTSLSAQHMVGDGPSLVREARLVAPDVRNTISRGPLASMHCQSHRALTLGRRPSANDLTSTSSILPDLLVFSAPLPRRPPCGNAHAIVSSSAA